ncbi:AlpA family transcriptional regulator [Thioalkalivibrio sp. ALJ16]|uniref:helix-turn-helix transcriptional regulator n=1 Tax=Thioalkalivibrio sp. ALJ16 TaxID=1158762 RepID=UPI00036C197B|nr:AlpA family phage regulatory protein [Thioalkalivibrio sp. ALJ16]
MTEEKNAAAVLRPKQAAPYLGMSRSKLHSISEKDPTFPRKIRYSARCVGWRREALDAWLRGKEGAE